MLRMAGFAITGLSLDSLLFRPRERLVDRGEDPAVDQRAVRHNLDLDADGAPASSRTRPSGPRGYAASKASSASPLWRPRLDAEDRVARLPNRSYVLRAVVVSLFQLRHRAALVGMRIDESGLMRHVEKAPTPELQRHGVSPVERSSIAGWDAT